MMKFLLLAFQWAGYPQQILYINTATLFWHMACSAQCLICMGQAWQNPWYPTTREAIAKAFNFSDQSGNTWEPNKVTGWNPYRINTFYNEKDTFKIYPVPVKIWHGSGDRSVDVIYSRNFQKFIQNANGYCELRELNSSDHGLSGGSFYMNKELILFFRRFDKF